MSYQRKKCTECGDEFVTEHNKSLCDFCASYKSFEEKGTSGATTTFGKWGRTSGFEPPSSSFKPPSEEFDLFADDDD